MSRPIYFCIRKIFWSDWGQATSVGLIESINFDGTDRQVIANETMLPFALAFDEQSKFLDVLQNLCH